MAPITALSDSFSPHMPPPASHAPKPTTEISGPWLPSFRISTSEVASRRGDPGGGGAGRTAGQQGYHGVDFALPSRGTGRGPPGLRGSWDRRMAREMKN